MTLSLVSAAVCNRGSWQPTISTSPTIAGLAGRQVNDVHNTVTRPIEDIHSLPVLPLDNLMTVMPRTSWRHRDVIRWSPTHFGKDRISTDAHRVRGDRKEHGGPVVGRSLGVWGLKREFVLIIVCPMHCIAALDRIYKMPRYRRENRAMPL